MQDLLAEMAENINRQSIIPAYYQLETFLRNKIYSGDLSYEQSLPSESEISVKCNISRTTIRKALSNLTNEGLVFSLQGKGTFVAKKKPDNIIFELSDFGNDPNGPLKTDTKILSVDIITADNILANKLTVAEGARIVFYLLLTSFNGEPLTLEKKYIKYIKNLPICELDLKDLPGNFNYVNTSAEHMPVSVNRIMQVTATNEEESNLLNVKQNSPIFLIEQTFFDKENNCIAWWKSLYRGDKYQFSSKLIL